MTDENITPKYIEDDNVRLNFVNANTADGPQREADFAAWLKRVRRAAWNEGAEAGRNAPEKQNPYNADE